MAPRFDVLDGYWVPSHLRFLLRDVEWEIYGVPHEVRHGPADLSSTESGLATAAGGFEGIRARWPILKEEHWRRLLNELRSARNPKASTRPPGGGDLLTRWQAAWSQLPKLLMNQIDMLKGVSAYTGFSAEMFVQAFSMDGFFDISRLAEFRENPPAWSAARRWTPMPGKLSGLCRFFPNRLSDRWAAGMRSTKPIFAPLPPVKLGLGIAAGNVPGNGLMLALLLHISNELRVGGRGRAAAEKGSASYETGASSEVGASYEAGVSFGVDSPPVVLVRNSRQAPILAPWVLSAIETIDPELVSTIAMLIWDYEDREIQQELLGHADLVIAAAGDPTIASIKDQLNSLGARPRFHAHGHKVSFDLIGREALEGDLSATAHLSALDSILWDQYGCLSARIHFVETGGSKSFAEYGQALTEQMRQLSERLKRGVAPLRFLHRAYETYKLLEPGEKVRVYSDYADDFLVVCDNREWNPYLLRETVNRCTGRVIVVRPVSRLEQVPLQYLSRIPSENLQTLGVACGPDRVRELAQRAAACGVTAIRRLGRAAFPRLAYSWDGYLPLDLSNDRSPGYFCTVEEVDLLDQIRI